MMTEELARMTSHRKELLEARLGGHGHAAPLFAQHNSNAMASSSSTEVLCTASSTSHLDTDRAVLAQGGRDSVNNESVASFQLHDSQSQQHPPNTLKQSVHNGVVRPASVSALSMPAPSTSQDSTSATAANHMSNNHINNNSSEAMDNSSSNFEGTVLAVASDAAGNTSTWTARIAPSNVNESSNVSSAGSTSDGRDNYGPDTTPEKSQPAISNLVTSSSTVNSHTSPQKASAKSTASEKVGGKATGERKRKRRRNTTDDNGGDTPAAATGAKTPKADGKISKYLVINKGSPQRATSTTNNHCNTNPSQQALHQNTAQTSNSAFSTTALFTPINAEVLPPQQQQQQHQLSVCASRSTPTSSLNSAGESSSSPPLGVPLHVAVQTDASDLHDLARKNGQIDDMNRMVEDLKQQLAATKTKLEEQAAKLAKSRDVMRKLLVEQAVMERQQRKQQSMEKCLRLGQFRPERRGVHFEEIWSDGYGFEQVNKQLKNIAEERNEITQAIALLRKRRPSASDKATREARRAQQQTAQGVAQLNCTDTLASVPVNSTQDDVFVKPDPPATLTHQEFNEQDEIYRLRREQLKKEEAEFTSELERLDRERNVHIRELKRLQSEDCSNYKSHPILNKRYLLLSLLGKGGFSEVWRAFDLEENKYVACKIHHVNKDWKEDKKANYVKHALREKDIHKTLEHPRIVRLYDLFTIDNHSFCTVLEYCDGNDLDFYLKQNKMIPEKEARSMVMQLVSALKYLNEIKPPVIHYDLKPANILLSTGTASGEIKITDFGLSKVMEDDKYDPQHGMDLTSQGAGTYWYLPPECFVIGQAPPKISSKVDVWSVGVIFYQCLYGRRPFGHDQTQARILEENTILNATEVNFPNKPSVSQEAKNFIQRCLQYRKEERAEIEELHAHKYLRPRGQRTSTALALDNTSLAASPSSSPAH